MATTTPEFEPTWTVAESQQPDNAADDDDGDDGSTTAVVPVVDGHLLGWNRACAHTFEMRVHVDRDSKITDSMGEDLKKWLSTYYLNVHKETAVNASDGFVRLIETRPPVLPKLPSLSATAASKKHQDVEACMKAIVSKSGGDDDAPGVALELTSTPWPISRVTAIGTANRGSSGIPFPTTTAARITVAATAASVATTAIPIIDRALPGRRSKRFIFQTLSDGIIYTLRHDDKWKESATKALACKTVKFTMLHTTPFLFNVCATHEQVTTITDRLIDSPRIQAVIQQIQKRGLKAVLCSIVFACVIFGLVLILTHI